MATDIDAKLYFPSNGMYYDPVDDHAAVTDEWIEATAGSAITIMQLVQLNADGKWDPTDADLAATTSRKLGFALTGATGDADIFIVVLKGVVRDASWNWNPGEDLYVSETVGDIQAAPPATTGDSTRTIGYAFDDDAVFFDPDGTLERKSVAFQFTHITGGAVIQVASPVGCYVSDAAGTAIAWGQIPKDAQKVISLKVWAVAKDAPVNPGGQMHCEFTFNAGASNAAYNTAATSWNVVNKDSEEADYVSDDVVHWVLTDADTGDSEISALAAGDSFELLAIYEDAADPDGDTDAKFRVVEVEYV